MCCGKETYEEVKEGRGGLTRRKVLRAMGVGTGLMALGGLTGCVDWTARSGEDSRSTLLAQGNHSDLVKLLQATKDQWKDVFHTLARAYQSRNGHLQKKLIKVKINSAKQWTLEALDKLHKVGISQEFNMKLQWNSYDKEAAYQLQKQFIEEFQISKLPSHFKGVLEGTFQIINNSERWKQAVAHILKEGGLVQHVRQELLRIKAEEIADGMQESSEGIVEAQEVSCSTAAAICAAAAVTAAIICAAWPNSSDCQAALAFAAAVCLAACVACGGCGGGGGVVIEP